MTKYEAYVKFRKADDRWMIALEAKFGDGAGMARYLPHGRGEPGTELRARYEARLEAFRAWLDLQ